MIVVFLYPWSRLRFLCLVYVPSFESGLPCISLPLLISVSTEAEVTLIYLGSQAKLSASTTALMEEFNVSGFRMGVSSGLWFNRKRESRKCVDMTVGDCDV